MHSVPGGAIGGLPRGFLLSFGVAPHPGLAPSAADYSVQMLTYRSRTSRSAQRATQLVVHCVAAAAAAATVANTDATTTATATTTAASSEPNERVAPRVALKVVCLATDVQAHDIDGEALCELHRPSADRPQWQGHPLLHPTTQDCRAPHCHARVHHAVVNDGNV
jgi:hypothetical protein